MAGLNMADWPKNRHILHYQARKILEGKINGGVNMVFDWPENHHIIPAINIPPKVELQLAELHLENCSSRTAAPELQL